MIGKDLIDKEGIGKLLLYELGCIGLERRRLESIELPCIGKDNLNRITLDKLDKRVLNPNGTDFKELI